MRDILGRVGYGFVIFWWFVLFSPFILLSVLAEFWVFTADKWIQRKVEPINNVFEKAALFIRRKIDPRP